MMTSPVETYLDPAARDTPPPNQQRPACRSPPHRPHMKEIVLGVLTLVSLFMVTMVVRKGGAPAPAAPAAAAAAPANGPTPVLEAGSELAGEVGSGGTTLDGMELDEDAIRTQQMLEQVSSLVKENPDSAATLVKRWLNRA